VSLFLLIISFLFSGFTGITNAALSKLGLSEYITIFVLSYYATAFAIGLVVTTVRRERGKPVDAVIGLIMGVSNAVGMLVFLNLLKITQAFFAFPVRSISCLMLTSIVSMIIWRERLSKSQWVGAAFAVAGIVLLTV